MAEQERDPYTGLMTTGHEWNGIKELTTPVPKLVWFFLILSILIAITMWVLYPAWPLGKDFTKGVLGVDQRTAIEKTLALAADRRASWENKIIAGNFTHLQSDTETMAIVMQNGQRLFADNCAACHGITAAGGDGFPSLIDEAWLWGGEPDTIMETLRVGINSNHPDTRIAQMLAFGELGVLDHKQRSDVTRYVLSLSEKSNEQDPSSEALRNGQQIFADQCSSCHGEDARGSVYVGAPNLTDSHWIYGDSPTEINATISGGRAGVMPYWEDRLTEAERKMLTLYLLNLPEPKQ